VNDPQAASIWLHQRGDDRPASKTVRETEAEAVAFIVSAAIGIRSSVDATDYIQLYDGNVDTLRQSLHRIQAAAKSTSAPCRSRRTQPLTVRHLA
jgi:hypothetical protein